MHSRPPWARHSSVASYSVASPPSISLKVPIGSSVPYDDFVHTEPRHSPDPSAPAQQRTPPSSVAARHSSGVGPEHPLTTSWRTAIGASGGADGAGGAGGTGGDGLGDGGGPGGSGGLQSVRDHTCRASWPQPVPQHTCSSSSLQRRWPWLEHSSSASNHVAAFGSTLVSGVTPGESPGSRQTDVHATAARCGLACVWQQRIAP